MPHEDNAQSEPDVEIAADSARSPAAPPAEKWAARDVASHARLWSVVLVGVAIDLWSKDWAFNTLKQGGGRELIPNVLEFHTTLNPGALFGIGAGHTEVFLIASVLALVLVFWMFTQCPARRWFMHIALGAILGGALGNMYDRMYVQLVPFGVMESSGPVERHYTLAPAAESGESVLYEYPFTDAEHGRRLPAGLDPPLGKPRGYVRDFIKIPTRWFGGRDIWPWVFNVADMLLVGGVIVLSIGLLRDRKVADQQAARADRDDDLDFEADSP